MPRVRITQPLALALAVLCAGGAAAQLPRFYLAAILWHLDRQDDAREAFEAGRSLGPEITLRQVRQGFSILPPEALDAYVQPLERMGLPDG